MKAFLTVFILSLFIFIGCQDSSSILEPNSEFTQNPLNKNITNGRIRIKEKSSLKDENTNKGRDITDLIIPGKEDKDITDKSKQPISEPNWITIPETVQEFSTSKLVNGSEETLLDLYESIPGGIFGSIQVNATLRFPRGAFTGERFITMSINSEFGYATFSPHGNFDKPVIYNATIMGLDLTGINPEDINFVYMGEDGLYYPIETQYIMIEPQSGKLQVIEAKLPHFSRYGWTRTK